MRDLQFHSETRHRKVKQIVVSLLDEASEPLSFAELYAETTIRAEENVGQDLLKTVLENMEKDKCVVSEKQRLFSPPVFKKYRLAKSSL